MTTTSTPRGRRGAAAAAVVLGGGLAWAAVAVLVGLGAWSSVPTLVAGVVFVGCWFGARILIRDIAERRRDEVDEYEMAQRNDARNVGYVATQALGWVVFLTLSVATNLAERGDDQLLLSAPAMVFTALVGGSAVPSFLLAWRLRHQLDD